MSKKKAAFWYVAAASAEFPFPRDINHQIKVCEPICGLAVNLSHGAGSLRVLQSFTNV